MAPTPDSLILPLCQIIRPSSCLSRTRAQFQLPVILHPRPYASTTRLTKAAPGEARRSRVNDSSLIINGKLSHFESTGADFLGLLTNEGQAYFDRTRYISILDAARKPILFFRPRRFGKSLTVDMLGHFHGLQHRDAHKSIYQGLDVQKDIVERRVTPGQFFVLKFDFSSANRSPDVNEANRSLKACISWYIKTFYTTYATYLDKDESELSKNIDPEDPATSLGLCVELVNNLLVKGREQGDERLAQVQGIYFLVDEYDSFNNGYLEPNNATSRGTAVEETFKSFWSRVKELAGPTKGIPRAFITGISPLALSDIVSGFNIATNRSFDKDLAGLCGLTSTDIKAALKEACGSDLDAYQNHLSAMTEFFNGYHFCDQEKVETMYNTDTCLAYLQDIIRGRNPKVQHPENSGVSEKFLNVFASSPSAVSDFDDALKRGKGGDFIPLAYDELKQDFKAENLRRNNAESRSSWRSLMLYHGGLTFYPEDPTNYLKIPNRIAEMRIAKAVLNKYGLRSSLISTLDSLNSDGNIQPVLSCYRDLMVQRDVGYSDFNKSEESLRDSFYFSLLRNPSLQPRVEFPLTLPSNGTSGRVDLVLQLNRHLIITEWKAIRIDHLDIKNTEPTTGRLLSREAKASILSTYTLGNVLGLRFSKNDNTGRYGKTLRQWVEDDFALKLKEYVTSAEVKKKLEDQGLLLRAHLVVVVGSRHILMWNINSDGELVDWPYLAGPPSHIEQEVRQSQPRVLRPATKARRRCSLCRSFDHSARKCPQRNATV